MKGLGDNRSLATNSDEADRGAPTKLRRGLVVVSLLAPGNKGEAAEAGASS